MFAMLLQLAQLLVGRERAAPRAFCTRTFKDDRIDPDAVGQGVQGFGAREEVRVQVLAQRVRRCFIEQAVPLPNADGDFTRARVRPDVHAQAVVVLVLP